MAPSSRDRLSVDLHGLKAALVERARLAGTSPSGWVRATLAEALDGSAEPARSTRPPRLETRAAGRVRGARGSSFAFFLLRLSAVFQKEKREAMNLISFCSFSLSFLFFYFTFSLASSLSSSIYLFSIFLFFYLTSSFSFAL